MMFSIRIIESASVRRIAESAAAGSYHNITVSTLSSLHNSFHS